MATYIYQCPECKKVVEVERPFKDSNVPIMDRCGVYFVRQFTNPAFTDRPTSPAIFRDPIAKGYPEAWKNI